jgi:hypothetical protein
MVSLKQFEAKAAAVKGLVDDVCNALPDNEDAEMLINNYDELWSMILSVCPTLDAVLSDVEK